MAEIPLTVEQEVRQICDAHEGGNRMRLGSGLLRDLEPGQAVCLALQESREKGNRLHAFCVMPNHVHLLLTPSPGLGLARTVQQIKGRSAFLVNKTAARRGSLWQKESFDHAVRSPDHYGHFRSYIERNPVEAKLCANEPEWEFSSAHPSAKIDALEELVDPRALPFVPISRQHLPHLYKQGCTYFVTFRLLDALNL
jgi:REP element-mobilizing transposase RayT